MNINLQLYKQINYFYSRYNNFLKDYDRYKAHIMTRGEYYDFLKTIENVFAYYWRLIKRFYKYDRNINLKMPLEGYIKVQRDEFIDNAGFCIEYIKDLNSYLNATDEKSKQEALKEIIDFYSEKLYILYDIVGHLFNRTEYEKNEKIANKYLNKPLTLAENKPVYSNEELGMTKHSYDLLINFFKSEPRIRAVWLHGSRLNGNSTSGSDVDLIIDCPPNIMDDINSKVSALPIPYSCDFSNIYNKNDLFFLKTIMMTKGRTKKIYFADDFKIYEPFEKEGLNLTSLNKEKSIKKEPVKTYVRWQDYYRRAYFDIYSSMKRKFESGIFNISDDNSEFLKDFVYFFYKTCDLLRYYLRNQGLFYDNAKYVVMGAFRYDFITEGDDWIILGTITSRYKKGRTDGKDVIDFCRKNGFKLFEDLNKKFVEMLEEDG